MALLMVRNYHSDSSGHEGTLRPVQMCAAEKCLSKTFMDK